MISALQGGILARRPYRPRPDVLRAYVRPTGLHSRAMVRVANALEQHAPDNVVVAGSPSPRYADVVVLHVIGSDAIDYTRQLRESGQRYSIIQYCLQTSGATIDEWLPCWRGADLVASYYDLRDLSAEHGFNFHHMPLGLDDEFRRPLQRDLDAYRQRLAVTTGYVTGPGAEAIEEVWQAAEIAGIQAAHVGPSKVVGMRQYPRRWHAVQGLSDRELADLYRRASWVAALRHVEGFELPAAEGAACGAHSLVFDQPDLRHWYGCHATYLPDRSGEALVDDLVRIFSSPAVPVMEADRQDLISVLDWRVIVKGFWERMAA